MTFDRGERQKRALMALRAEGRGRRGIPPLVAKHQALAEAALGAQRDLEALLATSAPSPWRAIGRLLRVLAAEGEDFSEWAELREEMEAAWEVADEGPDSAVASLLGHLDDALDELRRLAP